MKSSMAKFTLTFPQTSVDFTTAENLILIRVNGIYTDDVVFQLLQRLDPIIDAIPANPIRIWDAGGIPADGFLLTPACMDSISLWARRLQARRPDAMAYLIGFSPVSFGMGRMHAMKSDLEQKGMEVLRSFDQLPAPIRAKLSL